MKSTLNKILLTVTCLALATVVSSATQNTTAAQNSTTVDPAPSCIKAGGSCGLFVGDDGVDTRDRQCCGDSYCVLGTCKLLDGDPDTLKDAKLPVVPSPSRPNKRGADPLPVINTPIPPAVFPFQLEACEEQLQDVNCGGQPVKVLGRYCLCDCSGFEETLGEFEQSCLPSLEERQKLIKKCKDYKRILDCPALKESISSSGPCLKISAKLKNECEKCGDRCGRY